MTFRIDIEDILMGVEGIGVAILVIGALVSLIHAGALFLIPARRASAYQYGRRHLGRAILMGLEVLIVADIIRTVIIDQSAVSVAVLATIVIIRIVLSWALAVEIDGVLPWKKYETSAGGLEGVNDREGARSSKQPIPASPSSPDAPEVPTPPSR